MASPTASTAAGHSPKRRKKPFYRDLFFQVVVAVILGVLVGHFAPCQGVKFKPLGDGFIKLIKMMIGPIIFCTIVCGIAGMKDMKHAGRVGMKAILYFEVLTTLALIIGLLTMQVFHPGQGMVTNQPDANPLAALSASTSSCQGTVVSMDEIKSKASTKLHSTTDFFLDIIPKTFGSAFTDGEILQVLLVALLFSGGVGMMGRKGRMIVKSVEQLSHVFFNIIGVIVKLAPIGVFGAMSYSVSKFGIGSLADLGELILVFFGTLVFFIIVVLGSILRFYCKLSIFQFIRYIREELLIVFGTSSSETVLPRMIDKLTALGCARPVVGMVLPTGYSFNLDGSSLYFTLAAMFIAHATGVEISFGQQLMLLGVLLVTSKGAAGVYGSAFVVLAATLDTFPMFDKDKLMIGLALLFAIDRVMSVGRALTNLIGNGVATIVVSKWEKDLDYAQAKAILSGKKAAHLES